MFGLSLNTNIESELKAWLFTKRIKKFKKTKDSKLIIDKAFNTKGLITLVISIYIAISIISIIIGGILSACFALLIIGSIETPTKTSGLIALIVGILGSIGVIYSANKKRRDKKDDLFDNSIYLLMQYLIEIKRENYNFKLFKDDLSFIFMNIPNKILFILRDIQDNIKEIKNESKDIMSDYKKIIDKEVLFLIIYIREYYGVTKSELKHDLEQEDVIKDIITNSSTKRKIVTNETKKFDNKLSDK